MCICISSCRVFFSSTYDATHCRRDVSIIIYIYICIIRDARTRFWCMQNYSPKRKHWAKVTHTPARAYDFGLLAVVCVCGNVFEYIKILRRKGNHTYTHSHTHIYIYIYTYERYAFGSEGTCVWVKILNAYFKMSTLCRVFDDRERARRSYTAELALCAYTYV